MSSEPPSNVYGTDTIVDQPEQPRIMSRAELATWIKHQKANLRKTASTSGYFNSCIAGDTQCESDCGVPQTGDCIALYPGIQVVYPAMVYITNIDCAAGRYAGYPAVSRNAVISFSPAGYAANSCGQTLATTMTITDNESPPILGWACWNCIGYYPADEPNTFYGSAPPNTSVIAENVPLSPTPPPTPSPSPKPTPTKTPYSLQPQQDVTLLTPQYPSGSPPYIFGDPTLSGIAMLPPPSIGTAAVRRPASQADFVPCSLPNTRFDYSAVSVVKITTSPACPQGLGKIDSVVFSFNLRTFNAQDTPLGSPAPIFTELPCGTAACTKSFTYHIPKGSYIVSGTTYYYVTGGDTIHFQSGIAEITAPYNSKGIIYPQFQDTRTLAPQIVGFPEPPALFRRCPYTIQGKVSACPARSNSFAVDLGAYYQRSGFPLAILKYSDAEAHHIQPVSWGGNSLMENGVFLVKSAHDQYTNWWKAVNLGTGTSNPGPVPE
jgi:hypothetical protein